MMWKHTELRTMHPEVRRGRRLVVSFVATIGAAPPIQTVLKRGSALFPCWGPQQLSMNNIDVVETKPLLPAVIVVKAL